MSMCGNITLFMWITTIFMWYPTYSSDLNLLSNKHKDRIPQVMSDTPTQCKPWLDKTWTWNDKTRFLLIGTFFQEYSIKMNIYKQYIRQLQSKVFHRLKTRRTTKWSWRELPENLKHLQDVQRLRHSQSKFLIWKYPQKRRMSPE